MEKDKDVSASPHGESSASSCPFLSQFDGFAEASKLRPAMTSKDAVQARAKLLAEWLFHHPAELFAELRASRPILVTGIPIPTIVTTSEEVKRVLCDNDTFPVEPYQNPINTSPPPNGLGHFLLADLDLDRHDREKKVFSKAMRIDGDFFGRSVRAHAEDLIGLVRSRGGDRRPVSWREIDVIRDVAARLPIRVIGTYFGIPTGGQGQLPETCMYLVIARIFRGLFMNYENDPVVQAEAVESSGILREYVDAQRQARKTQVLESPDMPADLLGKFIRLQERGDALDREVFCSDERVVANLCGIVTGAVVGFVQSLGNIVEVLSSQDRSIWDGAVAAANRDDTVELWAYAQEALRFRPQGPGIERQAKVATRLDGVDIPAGNRILASHQSAMMDEALVPQPFKFDIHRPTDQYLHFGFARNKCLGIELAPVIITEALRAILRLRNVRRLPDRELEMGKPYPESFVLAYDP